MWQTLLVPVSFPRGPFLQHHSCSGQFRVSSDLPSFERHVLCFFPLWALREPVWLSWKCSPEVGGEFMLPHSMRDLSWWINALVFSFRQTMLTAFCTLSFEIMVKFSLRCLKHWLLLHTIIFYHSFLWFSSCSWDHFSNYCTQVLISGCTSCWNQEWLYTADALNGTLELDCPLTGQMAMKTVW